jgi:hypothetical protein
VGGTVVWSCSSSCAVLTGAYCFPMREQPIEGGEAAWSTFLK